MSLGNLKQYRNEILKAEIVSLFSLLEKTFTEWWNDKKFFDTYTPHFTDLNREIESLLGDFKYTNLNIHINSTSKNSINCWDYFINNNWRSWRNVKLQAGPEKFLQVLYGNCEGINSGTEKGSPSKDNQMLKFSDKPFLST